MLNNIKKQTANMTTILSINFVDIRVPKSKYLVFIDNELKRINEIDVINNNVTLINVFDGRTNYCKLSDIKDKFIKFVSIHSKITHSIQHTCIVTIIKAIKTYAESLERNPDDIISDIMNNKLKLPLTGKVVPCYIFPKYDDSVMVTSETVISNFELTDTHSRTATIVEIYRKNKTTIYTLKTPKGSVMCDRSDFKLLNKKNRKDLFYVL